MPIIVDKEKMRMDILMAFQRCIEKKPIDTISLRDIAAEAGMSHPKLLHYFDSKDDLILTYVKYTKDYMTEHCMNWFATHDRKDYDSNLAFMNDFMHYVAEAPEGELRPNATTQTYVLGHYKEEIGKMVTAEFREWREIMEQCLIAVYGEEVGRKEAEAMDLVWLAAATGDCFELYECSALYHGSIMQILRHGDNNIGGLLEYLLAEGKVYLIARCRPGEIEPEMGTENEKQY